jgi:hypothetical protein
VTRLEDRLRTDLTAESVQIEPGSIPALNLPALAPPPRGTLRRWSPRHWPAWVTALAAAAAVTAVIAGTFIAGHIVAQTGPNRGPTAGEPAYSGIPPYYAYAVQGSTYSRTVNGTQYGDSVIARYVKIRATVTGELISTISPPAPYNAFESFTGAANGRTLVFAANRYRYSKKGNEYYKLDQKTPLKFMILRITPGGRTQLSALSLPITLTEAQAPTLALAPDGTRLAVAYGGSGKPAVVQVITLATGQMRTWVSPPPAATPVLTGPGTWTADGRTLALGQMVIQPSGIIRSSPTQMRLLDTAAPSRNLATASKLITLPSADTLPWPFITPDGTKLTGEITGRPTRLTATATTESGAFGVYSARTGALLRVVARWHQHGRRFIFNRARQTVVWSNLSGSRLIVEMPRRNINEVGFLTGDKFTALPNVALAPLLNAINSGGFQTSGGYVGFAW